MRTLNKVKISVVVPLYNCEQTLDDCLKSILNQSFSDFEVICVNDGSTDKTQTKLERYKNGDDRITIINQINSGQSAARNAGVQAAQAEHIVFVDGDDVCSPYYLEMLYQEAGQDIIVCGRNVVTPESEAVTVEWDTAAKAKRLSQKDALESMLYNEIEEGPYCKLIPRSFLLKTPFPEGRLYEDLAIISDLFLQAKEIVFIDARIYAYVMRKGSTVNSRSCSIAKVMDYEAALARLKLSISSRYCDMENGIRYRTALSYLRMRPLCLAVLDDPAKACQLEEGHGVYIKKNMSYLLRDKRVSFPDKARFVLRSILPCLYDAAMKLYERKVKKLA